MSSDSSYQKKIPTAEELAVTMKKFNDRLWAVQSNLDDISREIGELWEELGETLRPIIRDYYFDESIKDAERFYLDLEDKASV